jgi:hypothetical protein
MDTEHLKTRIRRLSRDAWDALSDENRDRQLILEKLIADLDKEVGAAPTKVRVELYKASGKYYTVDEWRIPDGAIGPADMRHSPDWRRIDNGVVVVPAQEPWGFPHVFPA